MRPDFPQLRPDHPRNAARGLGAPLHTAYGVPLLARKGVAAVAATGMDRLLMRLPAEPTDLRAAAPVPVLDGDGWWAADAWQSELTIGRCMRARPRRQGTGAAQAAAPLSTTRSVPTTDDASSDAR
ncbi:hypothetical protein [Streptomyces aquilus]|uniref:hypothetical protein n=1 Tax=Streptomyces aquilus TaxID=2548456 RepID=UPI00369358D6